MKKKKNSAQEAQKTWLLFLGSGREKRKGREVFGSAAKVIRNE